jgi:transposase
MARAYSDDLRRKFLEAHEQGEGSLSKLAARFHVSLGWAKHISATLKRTGKKEKPPAGKRGRKSRITAAAAEYLRLRVKEQPDRTLAELREDLRQHHGIAIGITQLWTVLKQMGLRLKKSRSTPPSRIVNESKPSASSGGRKLSISIRRNLSSSTRAVSPRK